MWVGARVVGLDGVCDAIERQCCCGGCRGKRRQPQITDPTSHQTSPPTSPPLPLQVRFAKHWFWGKWMGPAAQNVSGGNLRVKAVGAGVHRSLASLFLPAFCLTSPCLLLTPHLALSPLKVPPRPPAPPPRSARSSTATRPAPPPARPSSWRARQATQHRHLSPPPRPSPPLSELQTRRLSGARQLPFV